MIYQKLTSYYYFLMCTFILLYNVVLYLLTQPILSYSGFKLSSTLENIVSIIIVICLLIDCIFIPIMVGANFIEYEDRKWLDKIFTGKNTDFGKDWYPDVGYNLLLTMLLYV